MPKEPCIYILTNNNRSVLYTGVTSDIVGRIQAHKEGRGSVFAARYKANRLVFMQSFPTMLQAIEAEKWVKAKSRAKKIALIEEVNPDWRDLADDL